MPRSPRHLTALFLLLVAGCTGTPHLVESGTGGGQLHLPNPTETGRRSSVAWPASGQASYYLDGRVFDSPEQSPVPIASVAKVMTAYVVVHHLGPDAHVVVDAGDVADVRRRQRRGESVVEVRAGEVLTRDQALAALLVPSGNNIAAMLAERVGGNWPRFLEMMNQAALDLGMTDTTYTDPSGYQPTTVSTAHDQLLLLRAALRSPTLARTMALRAAHLPVAGTVRNTNSLLGHQGFVAGKTGSTSAAGGCLVFRVERGGHVLDGAVLGQHGSPLIAAGLRAAAELASQALRAEPPR